MDEKMPLRPECPREREMNDDCYSADGVINEQGFFEGLWCCVKFDLENKKCTC